MDWLTWIAITALFIGVWHELNRFPATNESFNKLTERIEELEFDNSDLKDKVDFLETELQLLSETIDRKNDPEFYRALDDGDGLALYELEKSRGNIG